MSSSAWVVINPVAGGGKGIKQQDRIIANLQNYYDEVICFVTQQKGDGIIIGAEACKQGIGSLYCVGGDGTVQEVVQGMAEKSHRPTLGVVPLGTYNALGRMLKLPMSFEKNIELLGTMPVHQIDIGKINDTYFLFLVSIGKMAEPFHQVTSQQKGKFGVLSYFFEGMKRIPVDRPFNYTITVNNEAIAVESSLVIFALTNYVGSIKFSGADINQADGQGHLLVLKNSDLLQKAQVFLNALQQKMERSDRVISLMTDKVEIKVKEAMAVEVDIDGDRGPDFPLDIQVLKKHIHVFAP